MSVPTSADDGNRQLNAFDPLLDNHVIIVGQRVEDRLAQVIDVVDAVHAHRGPAVRRLHRHGIAAVNAFLHQVERRRGTHVLEGVARDADALRPRGHRRLVGELAIRLHRRMQRVLVLGATAYERVGADIGDAQKLEQALDGTILAVLAVKRAVAHVGALAAQRGHQLARRVERDDLMPGFLERSTHVLAASQRKLSLERGSAHQNRNFETHVVPFR